VALALEKEVPLRTVEFSRRGKSWTSRGLRMVRQAQMMARLTSTAPQYATVENSYVMSEKSRPPMMMMRMMDMRQTLLIHG